MQPSDGPPIVPIEPRSPQPPAKIAATPSQPSAQTEIASKIDEVFGDLPGENAAVMPSAPISTQPTAPPPGAGELPARVEMPSRPATASAGVDFSQPSIPTGPSGRLGSDSPPQPAAASDSSKGVAPVVPSESKGGSSGGAALSAMDGGCDREPIPLVRLEAVDPTGAAWARAGGAHGTSTGAFEVRRTGDIGESLTVWYSVSEFSTAVPGSHYEPLSGSVEIPAGRRSAGILVEPTDNANENAVKTVIVALDWSPDYDSDENLATVSINRSINPELGNIHSTWAIPAVGIEGVDGNGAELPDQPSTAAILVSRMSVTIVGPSINDEVPETYTNTDPVTVGYTVYQPPEQVSGDYQPLPGSVTLPGGVFAAAIHVTPIDDQLVEGDEWVGVTLTESVNYSVALGGGTGSVTIKDNDRNNAAPVANDDPNMYGAYEVIWNSTPELIHRLEIEEPGVLANDGDPDGDPVYVVSATTPNHAAEFSWCACGGFVYVPEEGYVGTDTFTYTISDGIAEDTATVRINVVDHAPVAVNDHYEVGVNEVFTVGAPGVLGNDWDPDEDELTAHVETGPLHGTLDYLDPDGSFRYTPDTGYVGADSFVYSAFDGYLEDFATVNLTVTDNKTKSEIRLSSEQDEQGTLLASDDLTKTNSFVNLNFQWLDKNLDGNKDKEDSADPYSYARNQEFQLTAIFKPISKTSPPASIKVRSIVRAGGADLARFPETVLNFNEVLKGYKLEHGKAVNLTDATLFHFPQVVKYYQHFEIAWEVSTDKGNTWKDANTSGNGVNRKLYLAYAAPQLALLRPKPLMETLLYYGTSGADGQSDASQIVQSIWSNFSSASAKRADGKNLQYYGSWGVGRGTGPPHKESYARLISGRDGQCGPWLGLLYATLLANGLNDAPGVGALSPVVIKAIGDANGFLVHSLNPGQSWTFGNENNTDQFYKYRDVTRSIADPRFNAIPAEITPSRIYVLDGPVQYAGGQGQNSTNPPGAFPNHALLKIGSTYYDPSYGKSYSGLIQFQQQSIAGIYKLDAPGANGAPRNMQIRKINSASNEGLLSEVELTPGGLGW